MDLLARDLKDVRDYACIDTWVLVDGSLSRDCQEVSTAEVGGFSFFGGEGKGDVNWRNRSFFESSY